MGAIPAAARYNEEKEFQMQMESAIQVFGPGLPSMVSTLVGSAQGDRENHPAMNWHPSMEWSGRL
jgi:hypothetical protein